MRLLKILKNTWITQGGKHPVHAYMLLDLTSVCSLDFASWRRTLDSLAAKLDSKGIKYVQINGRVTGTCRHNYLSRFQTDPEVKVLIMSLEIGSVG